MKKILFTGGDGKLCSEFKKLKNSNFIFLNKSELDITDNFLENKLNLFDFDYILHSAALTRPMILHDEFPTKSIETNIIGTSKLVNYCIKNNKKIIYISTDYVYPCKTGNYKETDNLNPPNKYGLSKLGGESSVMISPNHLILRLGMVEYPFPHKYAFTDIKKSCIWSDDVPNIILKLIDENGIYNIGGESKSIYEFVKQRNPKIKPIESDGTIPKDSSMNIKKLNDYLDI